MPGISRFYGMVVAMFFNDHDPPHIHVRYGAHKAILADPGRFAQVRVDVELGKVVWPNGADMDPDVLYSAVTGNPILLPAPAQSR